MTQSTPASALTRAAADAAPPVATGRSTPAPSVLNVANDRVIDECSAESFPASDPPSWWAGR